MTTEHIAGDHVDRRARALHAEAVARVPGPTLLQLQAHRMRARHVPARPPRGLAWAAGAAFAAVFAVAVGLRPPTPGADAAADAVATTEPESTYAGAGAPDGLNDAFAALDEDPDLYLWLASADAQPLAME
jgi:hypothetical protein